MPYIPQEILNKIIGCAVADDIYRPCAGLRVSLVSHTFHQIVLPYNFRSLHFRIHNTGENPPGITIPEFCKAVNAGDAHALSLAPLVQELEFQVVNSVHHRCSEKHSVVPSLKEILIGVLSFRNLAKLSMRKCVFSPAAMEQLGKLVQLQSLRTLCCELEDEYFNDGGYPDDASYGALSNLQSLHTLECERDAPYFRRYLVCIPMKNLRILKSSELEVIKALFTIDPPVQLKELWLSWSFSKDHSFLWNHLAKMTSLTHLSVANLRLSDGPPSGPQLIFPFQELQYLHIHVAFAPLFANQPLKKLAIYTEGDLELEHEGRAIR